MPNTKITRQKWKDHIAYGKKVYILGALIAIACASLIFTVTRYTPPDERAVVIQLVDAYVDTVKLEGDLEPLLKAGQEYDSSLEEVSFLSIAYTGEDNDYNATQVYTVQIYAGENDIYVQNEKLTQQLINEGYILPLEDREGFDAFNQKYGKYILWQEEPKFDEGEEDEDLIETEEEPIMHAYCVDMSDLLVFNQRGAIDIRGKYAVIFGNSKNANTSFYVLTQIFDRFMPAEGQ